MASILVIVQTVRRATEYGSRSRRRAVIAAVAAVAWALAAAAVVLVVPLGTSVSIDSSGASTRSSYTLLEEEGPGLLVVLTIPVLLALAGVIGAVTQRAWSTTGAACLLSVGVLLGAASIGLFFVPAAIAVVLAARWTAAGGDGEARQEQ